MTRVVLGSASPGRRKVLRGAGIEPIVVVSGVDEDAARELPLHVLERIGAIPYAYHEGKLQIAVADPSNLHGIDELRLATRHPLELGVASRVELARAVERADRDG